MGVMRSGDCDRCRRCYTGPESIAGLAGAHYCPDCSAKIKVGNAFDHSATGCAVFVVAIAAGLFGYWLGVKTWLIF